MLAVYGLRREELGSLEASRLTDAYVRRVRFEAQATAQAVWGLFGQAMGGGDKTAVKPGRAVPTGGKYQRIPPSAMLARMGVK